MNIIFASFNAHKIKETRQLLSGHNLICPEDLNLSYQLEETGCSFEENAVQKALHLHTLLEEKCGEKETNSTDNTCCSPIIAEDSGICVPALGGKPGVYSARFGREQGITDDAGRVEFLLQCLKNKKDRQAHYVCAIILLFSKERFFIARETWHGYIAPEAVAGTTGFGYDPVFYLPELKKTVSCISEAEKHSRSHRAKACATLAHLLQN